MQTMVANNAQVKFQAISQGICEIIWLRILLDDLKMPHSKNTQLYSNNKYAMCNCQDFDST